VPLTALRPKRSLGQNFLHDENISRKIINSISPQPSDVMVEIGPGKGALTKYLAGRVKNLIVVEIDDRMIHVLREYTGDVTGEPGTTILHADFLETDLSEIARQIGQRLRIVGNVPYHITSPILFHVLDYRGAVIDLTIMIQKEVARRIVAQPGTKDYGILSVFCQLFTDPKVLFDVSPNAFTPRPKVTSSVVQFHILEAPRYPIVDERFLRMVIRGVFGKRRKTLRNSLGYLFENGLPADLPDVDLMRRPEDLSIVELVNLANKLCSPSQGEISP